MKSRAGKNDFAANGLPSQNHDVSFFLDIGHRIKALFIRFNSRYNDPLLFSESGEDPKRDRRHSHGRIAGGDRNEGEPFVA
jgi:hypothetical protein